jgi:hypothetical protein
MMIIEFHPMLNEKWTFTDEILRMNNDLCDIKYVILI